jgi:cyclic dehypoxanthinyl futalosine synthase
MFTSATMMFGHIEGVADRVMHMADDPRRPGRGDAVQLWPGRYVSFISWPFQPDNTPLGRVAALRPGKKGSFYLFRAMMLADACVSPATSTRSTRCRRVSAMPRRPTPANRSASSGAADYLRTQALSRLFFDNVHSIGASWVTMGPKIGQLGLKFGANDMGSVMMEENVVSRRRHHLLPERGG